MVLCGDGINCENETAYALSLAGFKSNLVHTSELVGKDASTKLGVAQLIALPGGFSFGDEIASGKVLAIKLRERLLDFLLDFASRGKLVVGICNGFQILTQLGFLPLPKKGAERSVSLCHNSHGRFINKWVELEVTSSGGKGFFANLSRIELPIRHGEGRLSLAPDSTSSVQKMVIEHAPLRYVQDVNGSFERIAALTSTEGNVLGLMPHPEAFVRWSQHPDKAYAARMEREATPHGLKILTNARAMLS